MLANHVDDMLWATKPGFEDRIQQLIDRYTIKTVESGTFRFCGREVIQHSDCSVSVRCKDTTEKIEPVRFFKSGLFTCRCLPLPMPASETSRTSAVKKGRMTFLTGPDSFDKNGMEVHVIGYFSTIIGRVCRSTLQAETYALSDVVEESMRLRAALADAHGVFLLTDWEYHAARFMRNEWMIDCNSLNDNLRNPTFTKCSDKRLIIDLAALRLMVWLTPDGELREEIGSDQPDMVRWVDTSCMVADCLTKRMRSDRLSECLRSCWLDLIPTDESVL